MRAGVVPDGLRLGLRARAGAMEALRGRVLARARPAPQVAVVAVVVDAPLQLAWDVRVRELAVAVLAPVGEDAAGRRHGLAEVDVGVLTGGVVVVRVDGRVLARRDEAVDV